MDGPVQTARIAALKQKLAARKGKKEFAKNCEDLQAEIDRLEKCQDLDL